MNLLGAILMGIFVPLVAIAFCIALPVAIWNLLEWIDRDYEELRGKVYKDDL